MNYTHLTHTLVESFNALADEVQSLTDRKTVLEHKLRFAHEQVRLFHLVSSGDACSFVTPPLPMMIILALDREFWFTERGSIT